MSVDTSENSSISFDRAEQPAMSSGQRSMHAAAENSFPLCMCYYSESGGCQRYAVVNQKFCLFCLDEETNWACACTCAGCPKSHETAVASKVASVVALAKVSSDFPTGATSDEVPRSKLKERPSVCQVPDAAAASSQSEKALPDSDEEPMFVVEAYFGPETKVYCEVQRNFDRVNEMRAAKAQIAAALVGTVPAAFAGARAEQPGIAEVRVAHPGVVDVLAEQPDERWKSRADKQVQCGRCDRCGIMIAIADVGLCSNCFYETDASFKCDVCGYHEKDLDGLYHRPGSKLCYGCFDSSDNGHRRDTMKEIEREIAVRLAWYRNHMAKTDQATPSALHAASTHCHEVELELLERKLEVLKREVEQSLVTFAPTKLSQPHIQVSRLLSGSVFA